MTARGRDRAAATLGLLLLSYSVARAAVLPIFFDEAFTYLAFVRAPWSDLLNPLASDRPLDANNHVLNTLMAKASVGVFGISEFALRLPNLMALVSYLLFLWLLLRRFSGRLPPLAGFVILTANPFVLELFAASRGYGLSLGILAPALYLLARAFEAPEAARHRVTFAFLLLALAVLASYVMLNVFGAALIAWIFLDAHAAGGAPSVRGIWHALGTSLRRNGMLFLILAATASAAGPVLVALGRAGAFYWGGTTGFWSDTVGSVLRATLYGSPYGPALSPVLTGLVAVGAAGIVLVACLSSLWRLAPGRMRVFAGIAATTLLSAGVIALEHHLLGLRLPIDRVAVFLAPLFLLSFWLAASVSPLPNLDRPIRLAAGALAVVFAAHLVMVGRLWKSYLWRYDLDTPAMLADLAELRAQQSNPVPIRLGVEPFFTAGVDYYRIVENIAWLQPMNQLGPWGEYDFVYLLPGSVPDARSRGYELLRIYRHNGNALCRTPFSRDASGARPPR